MRSESRLDAVRAHLVGALAELDGDAGPAQAPSTTSATIDTAELARLVELADRLGLAPTLVLRLAIEALAQVLARPRRMVEAEAWISTKL
jgi:hypothetical protein